MTVTFSSNGINYRATEKDIFMDNGAKVFFIENGKHANKEGVRVTVSSNIWQRIKPHLISVDYEQYYGRKPLMKDVQLFKVKTK